MWWNWQTRYVQVVVPSRECEFDSHHRHHKKYCEYGITVVHQPSKLVIGVRLPLLAPNYGGVPEWPKGADCKSAIADFGGSNPPPTTILQLRTYD